MRPAAKVGLRATVLQAVARLIGADAHAAAGLVLNRFPDKHSAVIASLGSMPEKQYEYLKVRPVLVDDLLFPHWSCNSFPRTGAQCFILRKVFISMHSTALAILKDACNADYQSDINTKHEFHKISEEGREMNRVLWLTAGRAGGLSRRGCDRQQSECVAGSPAHGACTHRQRRSPTAPCRRR